MENTIRYKNMTEEIINGRVLYAYEASNDEICVVYTNDEKMKDDSLKTYAVMYNKKKESIRNINNQEDYKIIEKLLLNFSKEKE